MLRWLRSSYMAVPTSRWRPQCRASPIRRTEASAAARSARLSAGNETQMQCDADQSNAGVFYSACHTVRPEVKMRGPHQNLVKSLFQEVAPRRNMLQTEQCHVRSSDMEPTERMQPGTVDRGCDAPKQMHYLRISGRAKSMSVRCRQQMYSFHRCMCATPASSSLHRSAGSICVITQTVSPRHSPCLRPTKSP